MDNLEVTWKRTLVVWWRLVWRASLFGLIAGAVVGFIGGVIVGIMGKPEFGRTLGRFLGYIISIPISMWALKIVLSKKFKNFSILLVQSNDLEISEQNTEQQFIWESGTPEINE